MNSIQTTAALAAVIVAIAVLGGISGALAIRWLDERDRRKRRDPRPVYYRGAAPTHPARPMPRTDTRMELYDRDWGRVR
jgi:hypothetical protein